MTAIYNGVRSAWLALTAAGLVLLTAAVPAPAQTPLDALDGRVVLDGNPVAGVSVTLHRVASDTSGILASTTTAPDGRFAFELPRPDSGSFSVFFATVDYLSVRYFGDPVHPGEAPGEYEVVVRDTTSDGSGALRVARRDLVLVPHADGGWEVNEVVRVRNTGPRTIVSAAGMPTWAMSLPAGTDGFEAGAGDLPTDQVQRMGDRLLLLAPIHPGDREIFLRYRVPPSGRSDLSMGSALDSINIFVQQPSPGVTVSGVPPVDLITVEGQRFLQMSAAQLAPDANLQLEWESSAPPIDPILAGVGISALLLLIGAGAAVRNRAA